MNIIIIATSDSEQFCSDDFLKCYHYTVEIQKNLDGEGHIPSSNSNTTQTTCKLRVTASSYQHSNYRAIFSDESLKCYYYSVEIQKNFDSGGVTSPPQTQTQLKLHVSYE